MAEKPKNKIYLSFDRGTLLLRMPGDAEDKFPEIHDQFVWDDRVELKK